MEHGHESRTADLVILGGGPAGIQASRIVKTARPDWRVVVLRPEEHSMVYCAIPYAIEGLFPLEKTFKKDELVTETGAELVRATARSLDLAARRVLLEDGRSLSYERLLITTGAIPLRPRIPGIHARNVFTVKTAQDARRIIERLAPFADCDAPGTGRPTGPGRQKVVVVGSGAIGIEQAVVYASLGLEIHLVEMRAHLLPQLLDPDMAEAPMNEIRNLGVTVHLDRTVEALEGEPAVRAVLLGEGERIVLDPRRDFVVIAVGMQPDIGFLAGCGFEQGPDGLAVDARMRTSVPGVWAAGDCVSGISGIDGKPIGGKLATNAVPMAKVAARDILGEKVSYPGFFNGAATVVGTLRIGGTGFTETFARARGLKVGSSISGTTARFPMMPDPGHVKVKLVFVQDTGRLVGAQVIGTEAVAERIDLLTFAIQMGASVSDLAAFSYSAQPWQTFFPARNAIVEAATTAMA